MILLKTKGFIRVSAPDIHEHIPGTSYGVPSGPGFEYQVAHHHKFPTGFDGKCFFFLNNSSTKY